MSLKQISVFLENKPGTLLTMTGVLAQNHIDMRALSIAETKDFGIVRMIVDDVYDTATVLKGAGFVHSLTRVLGEMIPDEPGGLDKVLRVLAEGPDLELAAELCDRFAQLAVRTDGALSGHCAQDEDK